jgi:hypothetical protein
LKLVGQAIETIVQQQDAKRDGKRIEKLKRKYQCMMAEEWQ